MDNLTLQLDLRLRTLKVKYKGDYKYRPYPLLHSMDIQFFFSGVGGGGWSGTVPAVFLVIPKRFYV